MAGRFERTFEALLTHHAERRRVDTPLRRGMAHLPIPSNARTIRAVKRQQVTQKTGKGTS
jgi:hypothetical protein